MLNFDPVTLEHKLNEKRDFPSGIFFSLVLVPKTMPGTQDALNKYLLIECQ